MFREGPSRPLASPSELPTSRKLPNEVRVHGCDVSPRCDRVHVFTRREAERKGELHVLLKVLSDTPLLTSPCTINFIFGVLSRGRPAKQHDRNGPGAPGPGWELICLTRSLTTDLSGFPSAGSCHYPEHLSAEELACFSQSQEGSGGTSRRQEVSLVMLLIS